MEVRSLIKTILTVTTLCLSLNASANLIFEFNDNLSNSQHSVFYDLNGINLIVSAFDLEDDEGLISRATNGLGVRSDPDRSQIGGGEYLVFELNELFYGKIKITFSKWDKEDKAIITMNGADTIFDEAPPAYTFTSSYAAFDEFIVKRESGQFKVAQVELVPEPSALAILSLGLLGLGFRRFKKS